VIGDVNKSILTDKDKKKRVNELYVDIFERLNLMMNLNGDVLSSSIDGTISMRSFLNGCPPVRMLLAENLIVGKETPIPEVQDTTGRTLTADDFIIVDDMNFHQCMNLEKFDSDRLLQFNPPEGEFTALNYRITTNFNAPFLIRPMVEEKSETKIELILQVKTDFEADVEAHNVFISFHAPHDTTTCSVTLAPDAQGQVKEYREKERRVLWMISKVMGQKEYYLKVIFNLEKPATQFVTKEIGPVA
jgi:AP-4 complex subunit mu-1